jgi:hypothetical protein
MAVHLTASPATWARSRGSRGATGWRWWGAVCTDHDDVADRSGGCATFGQRRQNVGAPERLNDLQAAPLTVKLPRF